MRPHQESVRVRMLWVDFPLVMGGGVVDEIAR